MTIKRMTEIIYKYLRTNMSSLECGLKKKKKMKQLASKVTACISISAFASLNYVLVGITGSAVELKVCAITREI